MFFSWEDIIFLSFVKNESIIFFSPMHDGVSQKCNEIIWKNLKKEEKNNKWILNTVWLVKPSEIISVKWKWIKNDSSHPSIFFPFIRTIEYLGPLIYPFISSQKWYPQPCLLLSRLLHLKSYCNLLPVRRNLVCCSKYEHVNNKFHYQIPTNSKISVFWTTQL